MQIYRGAAVVMNYLFTEVIFIDYRMQQLQKESKNEIQ